MGKLFGTDGVRGVANKDLTPDLAFRLGRAGAHVLAQKADKPFVVIGKDTRISGDMLEAALIAGITSVGVDAVPAGVLPTPGVAYLVRELGAAAGVVISASHNPVEDNGIKFFASSGYKLPDDVEAAIESYVLAANEEIPAPVGAGLGRVRPLLDAEERYIRFLHSTIEGDLSGITVVIDGANGAASRVAPRILAELGATVYPIHCEPDGTNINRACGSTHPEDLQKAVIEYGANLGLANDGDADRLIAVDENGQLVDGDQIMLICALAQKQRGTLARNTVAVTVMSNMGLHLALKEAGIQVVETNVGDRYVLEALQECGAAFGGEQSGHILFLNHNTTGDGVLTAIQLLSVLRDSGKTMSQLAGQMEKLPQLLVNVRVKDKDCMNREDVKKAVEMGQQRLKGRGRILVRPSGTEPLIRVMGECADQQELLEIVEGIADVFRKYV